MPCYCLQFNSVLTLSDPQKQQEVPIVDGAESSAASAMHDLPAIDRGVHVELIENLRSLMKRTNLYLQESGCATEHVVTCIMDVRHIQCVSKESPLKDVVIAKNIDKIFSGLSSKNVITFEHYSTIKRLIVTLCSKSEALKMELGVYEAEFRKFTQSKLLMSAKLYDEGLCRIGSEDMVEIIITTDTSWNDHTVFMKICDLENTITNAFQCEAFSLHLRSIDLEAKSIRLWFAASASTLKSVFPLTSEEWVSITNQGVVELKCLDFHYKVQEKGKNLENKSHVYSIYNYYPKLKQKKYLFVWKK